MVVRFFWVGLVGGEGVTKVEFIVFEWEEDIRGGGVLKGYLVVVERGGWVLGILYVL